MSLQTLAEAKAQAKSLRQALVAKGTQISHAQSLELIAQQNGVRDWNTLYARLSGAEPTPFNIHDEVRGQYLGQNFSGRIVAISKVGKSYRLSIQLDQPIDTVQFASFSNMRRRIRGVIDQEGRSPQKTLDGTPQLIVEPLVRRR